MNKRKSGAEAETQAIEYLVKKGYEIVERNFLVWGNELDIVCWDKNELVFVEVRSMQGNSYLSIFELLDQKKLRLLERAINIYLQKRKLESSAWRLDFIGIVYDGKEIVQCEHLQYV